MQAELLANFCTEDVSHFSKCRPEGLSPTLPDAPLMLRAAHVGAASQASIVLGIQLTPVPLVHKDLCSKPVISNILQDSATAVDSCITKPLRHTLAVAQSRLWCAKQKGRNRQALNTSICGGPSLVCSPLSSPWPCLPRCGSQQDDPGASQGAADKAESNAGDADDTKALQAQHGESQVLSREQRFCSVSDTAKACL